MTKPELKGTTICPRWWYRSKLCFSRIRVKKPIETDLGQLGTEAHLHILQEPCLCLRNGEISCAN